MKKVARMLKERIGNVVTWWRHPITNAVSEGLNSKIQSIKVGGTRVSFLRQLPHPHPLLLRQARLKPRLTTQFNEEPSF